MKRFARRTNARSKKFENRVYALNLHSLHYNRVRNHETIRCTPVTEAGFTRGLHDMERPADVIEKYD